MREADCIAVWGLAASTLSNLGLKGGELATPVVTPEGCEVRDAAFGPEDRYGLSLRVERIAWGGTWLHRLATGTGLPERIVLDWEGLTFSPVTTDPTMTYLLREQSVRNGISGHFEADWSSRTKTLVIQPSGIDFPGKNGLGLRAQIQQVDASSVGELQRSAGSMAFTAIDASMTTNGLFEQYLLIPIGNALLAGSQDPEGDLKRMVEVATGIVDGLPDASLDIRSREGLKAFLGELPHPSGTITLSVRASPGISPTRFASAITRGPIDLPEGLASLLNGVRAEVTYRRNAAPN
jgi:hypothetical protein